MEFHQEARGYGYYNTVLAGNTTVLIRVRFDDDGNQLKQILRL